MPEEMPFSYEEIQKLRELLEVEAIRKLRNLYAHLLDSGDIDALAALFTEDAVCEFGPYGEWHGRETIRHNYGQVFREQIQSEFGSLHNTGNHWVELTSPTTAVGRSYLIDVLTHTDPATNPVEWFGVYDDAYRKRDGAWLIERISLQFLWPQRQLSDGFSAPFPPK